MNKNLEKILKALENFFIKKAVNWAKEIIENFLESPIKRGVNLVIAIILIFLMIFIYWNSVGFSIMFFYIMFSLFSIGKAMKNPLKIILWFFVYLFLVQLRNLAFEIVGAELKSGSFFSAVIIFLIMILVYRLISKLKR